VEYDTKKYDYNKYFDKFLRVLDAFIGALERNILLSVDNCAIHLQEREFLQNVGFVYCVSNFTSIMNSTRAAYGQMLRRASSPSVLMHL
jgi:hypothetical protein